MAKYLAAFGLLAVLGLSQAAEARVFFKRSAQIGITYSNIYTGTVTLVTQAPYEFRYSDDNAICLIFVNGKQLDCRSSRNNTSMVTVELKNQMMEQFINTVLTSAGHTNYTELVTRILSNAAYTQYTYPLSLGYSQAAGVKQIHDPLPESFHLIFEKFGPEVQLRD